MNTVERPEGFREKQAEMTAQQVQRLDPASIEAAFTETAEAPGGQSLPSAQPSQPQPSVSPVGQTTSQSATQTRPTVQAAPAEEPDYDDIPF